MIDYLQSQVGACSVCEMTAKGLWGNSRNMNRDLNNDSLSRYMTFKTHNMCLCHIIGFLPSFHNGNLKDWI